MEENVDEKNRNEECVRVKRERERRSKEMDKGKSVSCELRDVETEIAILAVESKAPD